MEYEDEEELNSIFSYFGKGRTFGERTRLYKNYSLFQKTNLIKSNKSNDLLFMEMLPIKNERRNIVIKLKNAFDKVIVQISEFELAKAEITKKKMVLPQLFEGQKVELKLLFLKNLLDKE
jgi:hypothetical protein